MFLSDINLTGFRNFKTLKLNFKNTVSVFLGKNGQGKTNLIEAMYLAMTGQSFRGAKPEHMLSVNKENCRVDIAINKNSLKHINTVHLDQKKKKILNNGKALSISRLNSTFPVVLFSPESLSAIKSGPEERRKLVDESIRLFYPLQYKLIDELKKTLKARNKQLKLIKTDGDPLGKRVSVLNSLSEIFIQQNLSVILLRKNCIKKLVPEMNLGFKLFNKQNNVDIFVDYLISSQSTIAWDKNSVYDLLTRRSLELRSAELATGTSLIGAHKHDIQFKFGKEDARYFCSQGQQRSIILSYKMAEIIEFRKDFGDSPILLLDDVLSELDKEKRNLFLDFLGELKAQIFLTTTDFETPQSEKLGKIEIFNVNQGEISPLSTTD